MALAAIGLVGGAVLGRALRRTETGDRFVGSTSDAVGLLEQRDGSALTGTDVATARRWFTSFGSCSVTEPLDDLISLGLVDKR